MLHKNTQRKFRSDFDSENCRVKVVIKMLTHKMWKAVLHFSNSNKYLIPRFCIESRRQVQNVVSKRSVSGDLNNSLAIVRSSVYSKYRNLDEMYERHFGIAEMRQIQQEVLLAQSEFFNASSDRKKYQDELNEINKTIRNLREKLDSTSRSSEKYLELITAEHKLIRQEIELEVELNRYKDKERNSFDQLSLLLRRSHECERLRMERSKYYQIISIGLSIAGSLVAIVSYKIRDQKFTLQSIRDFHADLDDLKTRNDKISKALIESYSRQSETLSRIENKVIEIATEKEKQELEKQMVIKTLVTFSWVPSVCGYIFRLIF